MADQPTTTTELKLLRVPSSLRSLIEGLIFAADEPLSMKQIKAIYEHQAGSDEERHIEQSEIQSMIDELNEQYKSTDRPYRIIAIAGGFQFATLPEYAEWLGRLHREQSRRKLSQSSLETLAMVAYKQPISKPEIEAIRGVNCDYVLKTLLEKELVTITGRAETVGRPLLYGTTREFLKHFGLNEITDLPRPREIEEILGESQFETERRMLEAQTGADQMKKEPEDFPSRLPHIPKKKPELDEDVRIVPKGRTKKLNVKPVEPGTEGATAFQEAAESEPAAREVEPADRETEALKPPSKARPRVLAAGSRVEAGLEGEEKAPEEVGTPGKTSDEVASRGAELSDPTGIDHFSLANNRQYDEVNQHKLSDSSSPAQEPEMTQPRRSRWTGWKEKIQTFIRKLFG